MSKSGINVGLPDRALGVLQLLLLLLLFPTCSCPRRPLVCSDVLAIGAGAGAGAEGERVAVAAARGEVLLGSTPKRFNAAALAASRASTGSREAGSSMTSAFFSSCLDVDLDDCCSGDDEDGVAGAAPSLDTLDGLDPLKTHGAGGTSPATSSCR